MPMSQDEKEQFEQSFQEAVKASLQARCAGESLRSRLLESLAAQTVKPPTGLEEAELSRFEAAMSRAVAESQDWAVDDGVALRVETAVGQQAGKDLLSERSAHQNRGSDPLKARYLEAMRGTVKKAQETLVAPPECRRRIEAALTAATTSQAKPSSKLKVVPLLGRSRWKRALAAVASVAAGFALIFGTLVGGAEKALAETVRQDHQRCCSALKGAPMKRCATYKSTLYGPLPPAAVSSEWTLVASRMCHAPDGGPMVHNVYLREGKTLSLHFLPPEKPGSKPDSSEPRQIADGDFPVMAWEASGWTVTACSTDLDVTTLASTVGAN